MVEMTIDNRLVQKYKTSFETQINFTLWSVPQFLETEKNIISKAQITCKIVSTSIFINNLQATQILFDQIWSVNEVSSIFSKTLQGFKKAVNNVNCKYFTVMAMNK